nr:hypothetical protein [Tanacetum cinerariifolium]
MLMELALKVNADRHKLTTVGYKLVLLPGIIYNCWVQLNAVDVNPTIYTSCIEQFLAIPKAKNINGEAHIHTKVDGKKVIISEATIRRDLKFEDERGVDFLLNEVIFEQLKLMGVIDLENKRTIQAQEISSLKKRVKRLEKKRRSRTHRLKRSYKVGLSAKVESSAEEQSLGEEDASKQGRNIAYIDADAKINLINETIEDQGRFDDQEMFDTRVLDDDEVIVEKAVAVKEPKIRGIIVRDHKDRSESTTIHILIVDSIRPKVKGIVMEEPSEETTTTIPIPLKDQDKRKGIMVEEPLKMKKKDQISFDEQEARRLQVELDQEQRLAEKEAQKALEANIAMIEQWHDVQAKIKVDFELAKRLQTKEQEQLTNDEKAKLFMEFLENRRKFFTAERDEEKRNRPPTKAQQRWDELEQESAKKQKIDEDQEAAKLKRCLEIVLDDEDDVTIDATPLSSKSPAIIDYKIHKEGRKSYF